MSTVTTGAGAASAPLDPPAGFQPEQPKSLLSYAKYADPVAVFLWVLTVTMPFNGMTPIRYAVAAYFSGALFLFARQTMPTVARSWPVFMLPVLCLISSLWALSPEGTLLYSVQLVMTAIVALYIAARVNGRHIILAYFAAEFIAVLFCLRTPNVYNGAWTGIFGQKNFFAIHMFFFYVTSLALALDRGNHRWLRLFAGAMIPLGAFMVVASKSGTTTLMLAGATAIMAGQVLIWQPASRVRHGRLLIAMTLAVLALFGAFIVLGVLQIDLKTDVLEALGKDSTLTGRTELWEIAKRQMQEHPWTGVGLDGFWNWNTGIAHNLLTEQWGIGFAGGAYTFHNSYYENGAAYGYPGFWVTIFLATWAVTSAALTWLRNQSVVNTTFLVIAAMVIVRSNSEADLGGVFGNTVVLLFIAAARKEFGKPGLAAAVRSFTTRVRP